CGTEMRRRPHERHAATNRETSERDVRFGPDPVFRMRGSCRGPPGDSGPRARPTTALATRQSSREASPDRTGRGNGIEHTGRFLFPDDFFSDVSRAAPTIALADPARSDKEFFVLHVPNG